MLRFQQTKKNGLEAYADKISKKFVRQHADITSTAYYIDIAVIDKAQLARNDEDGNNLHEPTGIDCVLVNE